MLRGADGVAVELTRAAPERIVRAGVVHCPEGRQIFRSLTVAENLAMGAYTRDDPAAVRDEIAGIHALFPLLADRAGLPAGTLSGGEQMMLAIGRALLGRPRLLLAEFCDRHNRLVATPAEARAILRLRAALYGVLYLMTCRGYRARQRAGPSRRPDAAAGLVRRPARPRPRAAGLHRRDLGEDQHGATPRPRPARRALRVGVPHGHWKTTTFVAGLTLRGMVAPFVLDGAINRDAFETYVEQVLVPELQARRRGHHGQPLQPQGTERARR